MCSPVHPALIDSTAPKNTLYLRQGGGDCGQTKRRCSFSQQTDLHSFSFSLSHFLPIFVFSSVCPSMLDLGHSIMSSCIAPENAFWEEYGNSGFRDHCTSPLWQKLIFHNLLICLTSSLNCILSERCPPTWLMQRFVVKAACYHIKPTDKLSAEPQTPSKPRYTQAYNYRLYNN